MKLKVDPQNPPPINRHTPTRHLWRWSYVLAKNYPDLAEEKYLKPNTAKRIKVFLNNALIAVYNSKKRDPLSPID